MMDKPVGASLEPAPLSFLELERIDSYWRAANYLSVGQIYLYDNPLLRTPLSPQHIKPRLLGHWGTTPGQNFVYVHLNRVIKRHDLDVIYISGPGHGGPSGVGSPESRRERSGGMTHGSRVPPEDAENRALACAIALGRKPQMEEGPMIDSPHVNTLDGCIPWGDAVEPPSGAIASNDERHGEEYGCVDWFCYEPQSRDQPVPAV